MTNLMGIQYLAPGSDSHYEVQFRTCGGGGDLSSALEASQVGQEITDHALIKEPEETGVHLRTKRQEGG